MKVLFVHPSGLMYTEVYLRLEPLGLERVAAACRKAGHEVRLLDLQVFRHKHFRRLLGTWRPDAVAFSLNYLANIPEVVDLARLTRELLPDTLVFVGGHSASFTAREILAHADGAIDCVIKGEGEEIASRILAAWADKQELGTLPGVVTTTGEGPPPRMIETLDDTLPARDLVKKRHKYFIGVLDPCASVEFSRGCPWNCTFCSAWTFYGRSYRKVSAERGRRRPGAGARVRRVHRRRRGLHPCRARPRHRRRDREARHPQAVLPGDPLRRPAQEQGGLRALEEAWPQLHVPGRRGDRRGGASSATASGSAWARASRRWSMPARSASAWR